jgi:hypothetical protein
VPDASVISPFSSPRTSAVRARALAFGLAGLWAAAAVPCPAVTPDPVPVPVPVPSVQSVSEAPEQRPLPALAPFLDEVRTNLHSDEYLLDQYTFTEKHVERQLDSKGGVSKVATETYEVYPSLEPGHTYRRLVEKDGKPLTAEELASEDRKHEKKMAEISTPEAQAKREAKRAESRRGEDSAVRQLFEIYDIAMLGREPVDGRSAILLEFRPKPGIDPAGRAGKILKTFAGRAWIDEADKQLVRVDAELVDTLSFGLVLARFQKGSRASILRRKINDEIWLPASARFTGSARVLLVKGIRMDATSEYSDYRKFQVATSAEVAPEPESPPAPAPTPPVSASAPHPPAETPH